MNLLGIRGLSFFTIAIGSMISDFLEGYETKSAIV